MGTFAETSIVVYRIVCLPRKIMSVFPFPFAANKRKFAVSISVCRKQTEFAVFRLFRFPFAEFQKRGGMDMETWGHTDMET